MHAAWAAPAQAHKNLEHALIRLSIMPVRAYAPEINEGETVAFSVFAWRASSECASATVGMLLGMVMSP